MPRGSAKRWRNHYADEFWKVVGEPLGDRGRHIIRETFNSSSEAKAAWQAAVQHQYDRHAALRFWVD